MALPSAARLPAYPRTRLPAYPLTRVPAYPLTRLPVYPFARLPAFHTPNPLAPDYQTIAYASRLKSAPVMIAPDE